MPINARSPFTIVGIALTVLASFATACTIAADDDSNAPVEESETDGSAGSAECVAAVQQAQSMCMPPQYVLASSDGDFSMIPIDDPEARIPVGPDGWLVQVPGPNHYVGSHHFDDGSCTVGCGWCQPGESLCHVGLDDGLPSSCVLCLPWDTVDVEAQCALLVEACPDLGGGADETNSGDTGSDGESDETSSSSTGSDGELDETSSGDTGSDGGSDESGSSSTGSGDTGSGSSGSEPGLDETGS